MVLLIADPAGGPLSSRGLADGARRLESHGFDSVWAFDAIGRGFALPDPLIAVAVAATVTERVDVGVGILQVPLRLAALAELGFDDAVLLSFDQRDETLAEIRSISAALGAGDNGPR